MNQPEHDVLSTHIDDRMIGVTESNTELNEEAAGEEVVPKVADSNATNESASATDPYPTDHDATKATRKACLYSKLNKTQCLTMTTRRTYVQEKS